MNVNENIKDNEYLNKLRHTAAHALAASVRELWPGAQNAIGPSIENGFYQDFDMGEVVISENDLKRIEDKMREVIKHWQTYEEKEVSFEDAEKEFSWNPYKMELVSDIRDRGEPIKFQILGDFIDLCKGGHLHDPSSELKVFKLTSIAGAYWKGSEKNKMLTRIYGTAFETKEELKEYLNILEEAKKRDHRLIGQKQELFFIDEMVGKGLIMWLPKGNIIKEEVENYAKQIESDAGYVRVTTPHIARKELFLTSGHLPYYEDDMFPGMEMDDGTYYLKAMNCPHHHRIYQHSPKSYRDLPLRFAEYGTVYRNELSGTLAGLLRVRGMCMNDAHIYCRKDQIKEEFKAVMSMIQRYFDVFGFSNYWFRLSKWDPNRTDKYIDEPDNWTYSQKVLHEVLVELGVDFIEVDDEAAFYGPKVDVQFKSAVGREETMSTVQLDFLAKSRFKLMYMNENGHESNDVFVIHRAPLSVHERFMAFLIENFAGSFPLWLSPIQVAVLPVSDKHVELAESIKVMMNKCNIRVHVDIENKTLPAKIRRWTLQKVPYMCIIGEKESQKSNPLSTDEKDFFVSVRTREGEDLGLLNFYEFSQKLTENIENKQ